MKRKLMSSVRLQTYLQFELDMCRRYEQRNTDEDTRRYEYSNTDEYYYLGLRYQIYSNNYQNCAWRFVYVVLSTKNA